MKKNQILVIGSVALDNVRTPFGAVRGALGGSGSFFSAAARFFSPVKLVAVVGPDFPRKYLNLLRKLKIDTDGIEIKPGEKTFRWEGFYGYDLNSAKTVKTQLGVFESFRPMISTDDRESRFVFLANIDPDLQRDVLAQIRRPALSASDTMNYWIHEKRPSLIKLLKKVDVFFCNDAEARELSGEYSLLAAASWILRHGPKLVIIKKGEHGVLCVTRTFLFSVPAYPVERVFDPTGAGDSFAGAFMGYLARATKVTPRTIRRAAVYGSVMASFNVESFSLNRLAKLTGSEIEARYRKFRQITKF